MDKGPRGTRRRKATTKPPPRATTRPKKSVAPKKSTAPKRSAAPASKRSAKPSKIAVPSLRPIEVDPAWLYEVDEAHIQVQDEWLEPAPPSHRPRRVMPPPIPKTPKARPTAKPAAKRSKRPAK